MLTTGLEGTARETVTEPMTAERVGSGDLPVLATPALLALVEQAAVAAVAGELDPGTTTVGARVELDHLAPTPVGAEVSAVARLEEVDGRKLRFFFRVTDPAGPVATGTHLRVVVDRERFVAQAEGRGQPR
ncbi:MAG TPA: hotdog domain-containing protein [Actinomycetota bacterium]